MIEVELLFDLNVPNRRKTEYCLNLLQLTASGQLDSHDLEASHVDGLSCVTLRSKQPERCDMILHFNTAEPS